PPLTEEFLDATLPGAPFAFTSSTEGRIELVADTSLLETADVPSGYWVLLGSKTSANRTRGNYYRCDVTANLQKQTMYLGRSAPADILFSVYESSTEGGTYSLVGSSTVTAGVGTNIVTSGEMNVTLSAGKFYIIGASWSDSVFYRWAEPQPVTTSFGEQLSGYYLNAFPSGTTAAGASTSTTLYPQQLIFSTNQVVRMDDSVDGSLISTNQMDLVLSVDGYTDLTMEFRHRASGEESNPADGIFFSDDSASTFTKVYTLSDGTTGWQNLTLDIDALAAANGLSLNDTFVIRFQQADNYGWTSDGREFDDIRVYSKPDLKAVSLESGGSTSVSKLWKGFTANKQIPLEFEVQSRGGNNNFSAASVQFGYELDDSGGTARWYDYDDLAWSIDAMEVKTDTLTPVLTIPAAVKLTDVSYTVQAYADVQGDVTEALENNNADTISVTVNHYSGTLWFDDVETDITISSWSTRVTDSPVEHTISGTGILEGKSFPFTNLKVEKHLASLDYHVDSTETAIINVPFPDRYEIGDVTYWRDGGVDLSR
ncbi:MAG: hypothetical protein U9P12_10210, partial [Verrucomicrobiota bacterium]|nr:hypothetical protein [Verrucomicrobiota bacterium]